MASIEWLQKEIGETQARIEANGRYVEHLEARLLDLKTRLKAAQKAKAA